MSALARAAWLGTAALVAAWADPALADCPAAGDGPLTLIKDGTATTFYPGEDGRTVAVSRAPDGTTRRDVLYRGLMVLETADGITVSYGAPLDPVFEFEPGRRHKIPVVYTEGGRQQAYAMIFATVAPGTVTVGACTWDSVVIDTGAWIAKRYYPGSRDHYVPALGVVLKTEIDHDFNPDTPMVSFVQDHVTDDPALAVPR